MRAALTILGFALLAIAAHADGLSGTITPQSGGGLGMFNGGLNNFTTTAVVPVVPCVQDGLDFTKACNAIFDIVVF